MKIITYSELRLNLKECLDSVVNDVQEIIVKRKNQKDVVMISLLEKNGSEKIKTN